MILSKQKSSRFSRKLFAGAVDETKSEPEAPASVTFWSSSKEIVSVPSWKLYVKTTLSSYRKMALTNVSISILRCAWFATSIFRNFSRKKRSCSSVILGFASFSQAILFSNSSCAASKASSRSLVERVKSPCWMAFSRLSMAVFVSRSCFSYSGRLTFSSSCKVISAETIAPMVASFISIFIVALTTISSSHSLRTGFLWQSVRFFLTDTHL